MYNFGGAIVQVVFILYFSQWLVVDQKIADIWFNATLITSSVLLLLLTPLSAAWGDQTRHRVSGLRIGTVGSVVLFATVALITMLFPTHAALAAVAFTLGLTFYLFSGIFWCALLPDITEPTRFGAASGWGQFGDWTGEIAGLLVALPLVGGTFVLFGEPGRAQAFLPATLLFLVFALPIFFFYNEARDAAHSRVRFDIGAEYRKAFANFKELCRTNGLGWFFLAFFFFNDGVITLANNFPIYLERVFGIPDAIKSFLILGIFVSAAIGALIGGRLTDRIGPRRALLWNLSGWLILFPVMGVTTTIVPFAAEAIVMGFFFGSVWVMARSLVAQLTPPALLNRSFSYYILMERFATLVGPLSWGLIITFAPKVGSINYHAAVLCMTCFVVIGFFAARKIPAGTAFRQPADSLVS